jgi:hypothetical protein
MIAMARRPHWVVIGKVVRHLAEDEVDDRGERILVAGSKRGMYAIACYAGAEDEGEPVAKRWSEYARAYELELGEYTRSPVLTWDKGKESGEIFESVDAVAVTLGFEIPGLDLTPKLAKLVSETEPKAKRGAWQVGNKTVEQWRYHMRHPGWADILELAPDQWDVVLAGFRQADPEVRALCLRLGCAAGASDLGEAVEPIADQLLATDDEEARSHGRHLMNQVVLKRYAKNHPFLAKHDAGDFAKAMKLLGSKDLGLRECALRWFVYANGLSATQKQKATDTITSLPETDGQNWALKHLNW